MIYSGSYAKNTVKYNIYFSLQIREAQLLDSRCKLEFSQFRLN